MAQLDRLLSVMVSQRATALRLDESQLAELDIGGTRRPVTKAPLTFPHVVTLVRCHPRGAVEHVCRKILCWWRGESTAQLT